MQYRISQKQMDRINQDFTYHAPHGNQPERYEALREMHKQLALQICALSPHSREQSLALTHLEQACFYANAAIARNEAPQVDDEEIEDN